MCRFLSGRRFFGSISQTTASDPLFRDSWTYQIYQSQILNSFDLLEQSIEIEGPKFVFYHLLMPHLPFVFDKEGNFSYPNQPFSINDGNDQDLLPEVYQSKYVEQSLYEY